MARARKQHHDEGSHSSIVHRGGTLILYLETLLPLVKPIEDFER
jgi:hypothetical protein